MIARHLRNIQSMVPWVRPLKFGFYNLLSRNFGLRIDPDLLMLKHLPEVSLVLDIGGNWGQSIVAMRRFLPNAQIVSFEPNPVLAERLVKSFGKDPGVRIENTALSSAAGLMTLHVPVYRRFIYDGLASLDHQAAMNWLNPYRVALFDPAKLSIKSVSVNVVQLDSFGLTADFIKIDVQGHELAVLEGAAKSLQHQPVVLLEDATAEIVDYLSSYGLAPYAFTGKALVADKLDTLNTFFMSEDKVRQTGLPVLGKQERVRG